MEFRVPQELAHMLLVFLAQGHQVACKNQPFMFTKGDGQPMKKASQLSHYWNKLMQEIGCPAKFGPHM